MKKHDPILKILWVVLLAIQMGQYVTADDRQMNDDVTTTEQNYPQIAMNRYGYLVMCWEDHRNGNADIYAQIYNHKGRQLTGKEANFQVNTVETDSAQQSPDIAINPRGHFVVVWEDKRSGRYDIYARLFTPKGDPKGESFQVNDEIADISHRFPQVAMDHDGNFVVCWTDPRFDTVPHIYAQRFDANGRRKGGNFRVNTPNGGVSLSPKIDMNSDGDFVISWLNNGENGYFNVYVQRYDSDGSTNNTNVKVSNHTGQNNGVQWQSIAMQENGDYFVSWSYGYEGFDAMIYARLFQWTGAQIRSQFTVHEETETGNHNYTYVIAIPDSGYQVTCTRHQSTWDIYTRTFDYQGQPVNAASPITTAAHDQLFPVVGIDERNIEIYLWQDNRNGNSDIYAARRGENVPLNVTVGSGFDDIVPIIWNPIFGDTENRTYNIYKSTLPTGPFSLMASVNTADRPFPQLMHDCIDNSVSNNVTYYYQVESTSSESTGRSEPVIGQPNYPSFRIWSNWTDTPPAIDGLIESGEWENSEIVDISVEWTDLPVQIHVLNDSSALYLAIDDPNDTTLNPGNLMGFMFDLNRNNIWDSGEGRFEISSLGAGFRPLSGEYPDIGVGALTLADGITSNLSTASGHMQYEVAIDFETSMLHTEANNEINAGFWIDDPGNFYPSAYGNAAIWPPNALWETPRTLGKFILDADFPLIPVIIESDDWPMFKRTREQDSWARYEDELYPPFDEPMTYYEPFVGGLAYDHGITLLQRCRYKRQSTARKGIGSGLF